MGSHTRAHLPRARLEMSLHSVYRPLHRPTITTVRPGKIQSRATDRVEDSPASAPLFQGGGCGRAQL